MNTKFINQVVGVLIAAVLLVPLLVSNDTLYPFIFGKIVVLRLLIDIGLVCAIVVFWKGSATRFALLKKPLFLALAFLIVIQVITSLVGVDPFRSFFSTQERMTGILTTIHFTVWTALLVIFIDTKQKWLVLGAISLCASIIVSLYGITQLSSGPLMSTLGNAIYISVFALMNAYLSAILFTFSKRKPLLMILSIIAFAVNVPMIFLAGERGPILAFIASIAFFCVLSIVFLKKGAKIAIASVFAVFALLIMGLLYYGSTPKGDIWVETNLPSSIKRVVLLKKYWNPENRFEVWRIGWEGLKERPVLGWGMENFTYIFQKYYTKPIPGEGTTYFDRSHNQIIDMLISTGIVGTLVYLLLWVILYATLWKGFQRTMDIRKRIVILLFASAFLAYFLQNLTVFDTPAPLIMFYFFLAFAFFVTHEEGGAKAFHVSTPFRVGLGVSAVLVVVSVIYWNIIPFVKSSEIVLGIKNSRNNPEKAMEYFKKGLRGNDFTNLEGRQQFAKTVLNTMQTGGLSKEKKVLLLNSAISEMEKSVKEYPLDVKNYYALSALYRTKGEDDQAALDKAEIAMKRAAELAPFRPETFTESLSLYVMKKDIEKSKQWAEKVALYVENGPGQAHYELGVMYLRLKDYSKMYTELWSGWQAGYDIFSNASVIPYLAKTIDVKDITKDIIQLIDTSIAAYPKNADFIASQIVIHYRAGDTALAMQYLEHARSLNPDFAKEIEKYLGIK